MQLLGCSFGELKEYIEKRWKPGMTWENRGKGEGKWNLDHINPIGLYDLRFIDEQKKCFHYTNLQPLWQEEHEQKTREEIGFIMRVNRVRKEMGIY